MNKGLQSIRCTKKLVKTSPHLEIKKGRNFVINNRNSYTPSNSKATVSSDLDIQYKKIPQITSSNWCIYDENQDKFIGFRQSNQREIASLTKVMTAIIAINLIQKYQLDRDIVVRVSKTSASLNGTSANLIEGTWIKLYDLLYGAMLPSGNDAAYLLAQIFGLLLFFQQIKRQQRQYYDIESIDMNEYESTHIFVSRFLKQMNKKCKQLKMFKTSFANPHGLANVLNFSTALDVLILSRYVCENQLFKRIMSTSSYQYQVFSDDLSEVLETRQWVNTNKLLNKGWCGVKTGQTIPAGACLTSYKQGVYIIVLNCSNIEARFDETETLFNWYMNRVKKISI